jgi:hypothetical protein
VKLRILPEAKAEAKNAARYYDGERKGLGAVFAAALAEAVDKIRTFPRSHPPAEIEIEGREIRWARAGQFSYLIVFEVRQDELVVLAVAHSSREPGYWTSRN